MEERAAAVAAVPILAGDRRPAVPRFYITTPIYYVNALPHLGTFYTTVVADALARFHRAVGDQTFFLTGLDEHGQKIERIALERGLEPRAYCDGIAEQFEGTWRRAEISNDAFVRTSGWAVKSDGTKIARHGDAVADMWNRMKESVDEQGRPDIYEDEYDGMYCVGCEDWKSEDDITIENGEKVCPIHRRPVERVKEKNWFFRLSRYADYLLDLYEQRDFIRPETRRNEVASFVRGGLRNISISRLKKSVEWALPVPGDDDHTVYVWIDALTNYLTALGGPTAVEAGLAGDDETGQRWAESHHLIAKDILRFHAVYWPAMLKSARLPPPRSIFCHGYLTVKGQKISKSMPATRVDPMRIADDLGIEPLRYFVLREYTLGGDGDFTYEALLQRYESDLGNDLGNLVNRTVSMVHRYLKGDLPAWPGDNEKGDLSDLREAGKIAAASWTQFSPSLALDHTWGHVRDANRRIDLEKPWNLAKDTASSEALRAVLTRSCAWLRTIASLIAPAMPDTARKILQQIGRPESDAFIWPTNYEIFWPGGTMAAPVPLFPRLDPDRKSALIAKWLPPETVFTPAEVTPSAEGIPAVTAVAAATGVKPAPPAGPTPDLVAAGPANVDKVDFDRMELRAARVLACERVPKTDKLLTLTLDIGTERRTVVSGIAGAYDPAALVGRTVVYLANLKPAKIRGVVSQGMILAAGDADGLALCALDRDVVPGTRIR
jgi:methionyl-tRNA synthetase